jgi:hypothetical protein
LAPNAKRLRRDHDGGVAASWSRRDRGNSRTTLKRAAQPPLPVDRCRHRMRKLDRA